MCLASLSPLLSSSEKTTSYRRTSGSGVQGKCAGTPTGGHDEPYCSLLGNGVNHLAAQTPSVAPLAAAAAQNTLLVNIPPPPRQRRNAMVGDAKTLKLSGCFYPK